MNYRRTLIARKIAILGVIAVCVTGTGAAAWIIGGPITGTTRLNSASIDLDWMVSDTTRAQWLDHGHDHFKLYDVLTSDPDPITEGFVDSIWTGLHYAVDIQAVCTATSSPLPWDVTITFEIRCMYPMTSASGVSLRECHDGTTWTDVTLTVVSDIFLSGNVLTRSFYNGETLMTSLELYATTLSAPQMLWFTATAVVN